MLKYLFFSDFLRPFFKRTAFWINTKRRAIRLLLKGRTKLEIRHIGVNSSFQFSTGAVLITWDISNFTHITINKKVKTTNMNGIALNASVFGYSYHITIHGLFSKAEANLELKPSAAFEPTSNPAISVNRHGFPSELPYQIYATRYRENLPLFSGVPVLRVAHIKNKISSVSLRMSDYQHINDN